MREYGQVQCSYWRSEEIKKLKGRARELGVYLLTGPHSNGIGCYYLPDGYLIADLVWDAATIAEGFAELSGIGFARRCESTNYILIPQFLKWNEIANANVAKARVKEFETVPKRSAIFPELCAVLEMFGNHWPNGFGKVLADGRNQDPTRPEPTRERTEPNRPEGPAAAPQVEEKSQRKGAHGTPEDEELARRIYAAILVVVPSAKEPNWNGWANAIRLMREQDERTHDEIWALFDWANRDSFWRTNILSPATLRDKWTQLAAKAGNRASNTPRPPAPPKENPDGRF